MATEFDASGSQGINRVVTIEGRMLSYREGSGGVRLYRGAGELRRLIQLFDPTTFRGIYGSGYGDPLLEHKLSGLVIVGGTGAYYGLDTDGLNFYVRATGGLFPVKDGEDLPDTLRMQLPIGTHVYFPTARLLEQFGVQRRSTD